MHRIQEVRKYNPGKFHEILTIHEIRVLSTLRKQHLFASNSRFRRVLSKPRVYLNSGRRAGSIHMYFVDIGPKTENGFSCAAEKLQLIITKEFKNFVKN